MGNLDIALTSGETKNLTAWIELDAIGNPMNPSDTSYGSVSIANSDAAVASFNPDPTTGAGTITALTAGTTTITGSATSPTSPNPTIIGTATVTVTGQVATSLLPVAE